MQMLLMSSAIFRGAFDAWIDAGRQDFFEPVVCIGVIVEANDFPITGRAIQVESLSERSIRVEPNSAHLASRRHTFELAEDRPMTTVAKQVGNAVPPLLASRIAKALAAQLDTSFAGARISASTVAV